MANLRPERSHIGKKVARTGTGYPVAHSIRGTVAKSKDLTSEKFLAKLDVIHFSLS